MEDFTKKRVPLSVPMRGKATHTPLTSLSDEALAKEGLFRLPDRDPNSPTGSTIHELVGVKPGDLEEKRRQWLRVRSQVLRDLKSEWTCTQCRRVSPGANVRVKRPVVDGEEGVYICMHCEGPVIRSKDAPGAGATPPRGSVIV